MKRQAFDVVLLDYHMPVLDGLATTQAIRAMKGRAAGTKVILVTADVVNDTRKRAIEVGVDEFTSKPLQATDLQLALLHCGLLESDTMPADLGIVQSFRHTTPFPLSASEMPVRVSEERTQEATIDFESYNEIASLMPEDTLADLMGTLFDAPDGSIPVLLADLERGDIATISSDFGRRATGQLAHGEACLALHRGGSETGDIDRQVPALTVVELIGEGRHIGTFDAQAEGVVEIKEAQPVQTCDITQIRWRWLQADAGRPVTQAGIAVAHRAMLSVERRTTLRVRCQYRALRHLIELGQTSAQFARGASDFLARLAQGNRLTQIGNALLQFGAAGLSGQGDDQALQHIEKFQLLLVFASIDDLVARNGGRVISADVTDQMQCLYGTIERFANGEKTEAGQQRQHQPGKGETKADHQCIPNENGWH